MRIVLIGYVWPEDRSSAAGLRDLQLIQLFRAQGWETHFWSASKKNEYAVALEQSGVQTKGIHLNDPEFDQQLRALQPDYVLFDRFVTEEQFGWRVRSVVPQAIRVLDTQDLHFLRKGREDALHQGLSLEAIATCNFSLNSELAIREISSIYRSDLTLVLSSFERQLLEQRFCVPPALLHLSRFLYPAPEPPCGFDERKHFAFIGNFRHAPNADCVQWLRQSLWPVLQARLPGAELHIYGAYPPKEMSHLHAPDQGFWIKGPTDHAILTLSRYRLLLAPLRFGAGIKGKITDSWAAGTPVITTPIGAEGMTDGQAWSGAIGQNCEQICSHAERLYTHSIAWQQAQLVGLNLLRQYYAVDFHGNDLIGKLADAHLRREELRSGNFTGQMLWHHGARSTEYFSRWLELKNQKAILDL